MGVQGFQEYLEKRCPGAAVPVDLLKLARTPGRQPPHHHPHHPGPMPPPPPARILIDADSGLQRLYGGYQTDWVCGGEWNAMLGYLSALSQACLYQGGLELVVVFNGTLGKERWPEWARRAQGQRQTAQLIVNHVGSKATPPPRAWFLPPACLSHCVRLAMFRFRVRVVQTLEDHHQEVLSLYRDFGFCGLIAQDSEFALCNVPAYFSSHALKLSWNGKNLTTHQYLLSEAARQLGLKTQHLPCFTALLGNHILPDEDLAAFHWSLLGPEHPLASLKVRAHQLVLPPCEVVIKAVSEYVSSIKDLGNLDVIARDVFKQSQSRMEDKVQRFKRAVEYFSAASKPRPLSMGTSPYLLPGFGLAPFGGPPGHMGAMQTVKTQYPLQGVKPPYQNAPYGPGNTPLFQNPPPPLQDCNDSLPGKMAFTDWSAPYDQGGSRLPNHHAAAPSGPSPSPSSSSDGDEPNDSSNHLPDKSSRWDDPSCRGGGGDGSHGNIPSLLSMATRSHMDITTPPLPQVSAEVLRVAEHRHRRGLMYPEIYHILTKGEIKMAVCIEDDCNSELPPASLLFRAARQYSYGVLFSLAETHRRLERLAMRNRGPLEVPPVIVKEWSSGKSKSALTPELVPALCFREWTCPNLRRLWLGRASEDRSRRTRAFLACLRSDCPALLNPAQVPQHLLLMCCVLRYMMQWPGGRILQRHELDAFLAQAVSNQLYEPDQLQELKVEKVDGRGVQLASLFMAGVDTALLVNDVCGQPLPWEHCCPWGFFDGKLFQTKLARAARDRQALLDMCEGQEELVSRVEKMRQAILEGINFSRPPPPPPPLPPLPSFLPPPPSTLCLPSTLPDPWATCHTTTLNILTLITTHTQPSIDPEPSQVCSRSPPREGSWR
ncbi:constitutive coactivator of PPAR-gamma-like protein 2 isoform X1 [Oncorhynchus tshawytscha]|uniref:constitutive coactivator of PPAR-gamma-like protein 2 isoform X1 n=1 Tax=Oncorhynchus tshawytscha TaxID=74940 RepID=UPI001C3C522D|nr:constitutive coactivator of PPAR-gamma-like protein 2 isoform X1 [Oncorhynchus tshawytscha]XP_042155823.1 constitutive coactivator of PPAR-gamma-like protein 2 isoform X2 [Oncorhynchus tshawytscha]XP_042155824.1 constitutive coactivator of PPAR-gamma-like protein 2 isoform X1 [Oncorhynchus tshawytscha]